MDEGDWNVPSPVGERLWAGWSVEAVDEGFVGPFAGDPFDVSIGKAPIPTIFAVIVARFGTVIQARSSVIGVYDEDCSREMSLRDQVRRFHPLHVIGNILVGAVSSVETEVFITVAAARIVSTVRSFVAQVPVDPAVDERFVDGVFCARAEEDFYIVGIIGIELSRRAIVAGGNHIPESATVVFFRVELHREELLSDVAEANGPAASFPDRTGHGNEDRCQDADDRDDRQ